MKVNTWTQDTISHALRTEYFTVNTQIINPESLAKFMILKLVKVYYAALIYIRKSVQSQYSERIIVFLPLNFHIDMIVFLTTV